MSRKLRRCWTYIGGRWRSNGHAGMTLTIRIICGIVWIFALQRFVDSGNAVYVALLLGCPWIGRLCG